ncbi:MAG: hypothetical protein QXD56_00645 [Saccharolobus sp.]
MPWGPKGVHDPYVEWLVSMINGKVEAQVPGYEKIKNEYPATNGISENPDCFTIDVGNVVFQDEREEVR